MSSDVNQWSANQERFIEWLALPTSDRVPATQQELAEVFGVRAETLTRWKRLDGLVDDARTRARKRIQEHAPDVYGAIAKEAINGSAPHAKLFLDLMGDLVQKVEHSGNPQRPLVIDYGFDDSDDETD